jgi:tetratricopeptide (TPR) repeat protein
VILKLCLRAMLPLSFAIFFLTTTLAQDNTKADNNLAKNRADAIGFLNNQDPLSRASGLAVLAEIGVTSDADTIVPLLSDSEPELRKMASDAIWRVWSRTGNKDIDQQFDQSLKLMQSSKLEAAHKSFSALIKKQPRFAEAWNKRATILFMQGKFQESLKDCDEVMKLNPNHFGALSGMGQIYIKLGQFKQAAEQLERAQKINPNLEGTQALIEQIKALEKDRAKAAI